MFTIHANLDIEAMWSRVALPAAVATRISYYAALTAVLGPADAQTRIYAPSEVDASRIDLPVALRAGKPTRPPDLVWGDVAQRAANDRRLAMQLAAEHGIGVPGAHAITAVDELAMEGPWVAKGLWTSAGRDRCHGFGPIAPDQRVRVTKLLERFGALVVEPWLPRSLDVGVCAMVAAEGVRVEPPHGLVTDARGTFLGIDLSPPLLLPDEHDRLVAFVAAAGARLAALGYRGPIAVDAFLGGTERILCVCEINARYSFGWVARGMRERFGTTRLGFGAAPPDARVLIAPAGDGITAWIA